MRSRKRFMAALVVLAVTVAGCAGGMDAGLPGSKGPGVILAAASSTTEAGSSRITLSADVSGADQEFAIAGEGVFDYANRVGSMTFTLSGDEIPEAFAGYEIRFIKDLLYMKFPAEFAALAPSLKPWIRIDIAQLAKKDGGTLPGFNTFANQDPTSVIAFMRGAKDIKARGRENLRGTETTHFTMVVDLKKALEQLPEEQRAGLSELVAKSGLSELPMDVWIDGDGRARRIKFAMDLARLAPQSSAPPESVAGIMTITTDLFDFGVPVDVSAPPPGDVSDFSELAKLQQPA